MGATNVIAEVGPQQRDQVFHTELPVPRAAGHELTALARPEGG